MSIYFMTLSFVTFSEDMMVDERINTPLFVRFIVFHCTIWI